MAVALTLVMLITLAYCEAWQVQYYRPSTSTRVIYDHMCDIMNPCRNGGSCIKDSWQGHGGYRCQCYGGYYGKHCQMRSTSSIKPSTPTIPPPPPPSSTPVPSPTPPPPTPEIHVDHICDFMNPCDNGGSCIKDSSHGYKCHCYGGYYGKNCDKSSTKASSTVVIYDHMCDIMNPCRNGGSCIKDSWQGHGGYRCQCYGGYYGRHCEMRSTSSIKPSPTSYYSPSPSSSRPVIIYDHICDIVNPCGNGGSCIKDSSHGYKCHCYGGYYGKNCDKSSIKSFSTVLPPPPSSSTPVIIYDHICDILNPCGNGGSCIKDSLHGYRCYCFGGYYGKHCDMSSIKSSSTVPPPPPSSSTPVPPPPPSSSTPVVIYDHMCDIMNPCRNGGSCIKDSWQGHGGYRCQCYGEYYGRHCEMRSTSSINPSPTSYYSPPPSSSRPVIIYDHMCDIMNPCRNGGSCIKDSWSGGYQCHCYVGYYGKHCEMTSQVVLSTVAYNYPHHKRKRSVEHQRLACKRQSTIAKNLFSEDSKEWDTVHPAIKDVAVDLAVTGDHMRAPGRMYAQIRRAVASNSLIKMRKIMSDRSQWRRVPADRFLLRKLHLDEALKNPFGFALKRQSKLRTCE